MTALLTPIAFTLRTGHWLSSFRERAVNGRGEPLPWYTYPAIDFLAPRRHLARRVLEFGAGQSTLWWASDGAYVLAMEDSAAWIEALRSRCPANVSLHEVRMTSAADCVSDVAAKLEGVRPFDVVVIDGLYRAEVVPFALRMRAPDGIIIADNAEGYGLWEALDASGLHRVDFWGFAPGVILPHCTSIYFADGPWMRGGHGSSPASATSSHAALD